MKNPEERKNKKEKEGTAFCRSKWDLQNHCYLKEQL